MNSTLDSKIEAMAACKGELSRIDSARHRLREEMAAAQSELRACEADARAELAAYTATPHVSAEDEASPACFAPNCCPSRKTLRRSACRRRARRGRTSARFWEARRDAATQAEKGA